MEVSHVEKNMVEQFSTVSNTQSVRKGVLKPYLGLDLINPQSSCQALAPNPLVQKPKPRGLGL